MKVEISICNSFRTLSSIQFKLLIKLKASKIISNKERERGGKPSKKSMPKENILHFEDYIENHTLNWNEMKCNGICSVSAHRLLVLAFTLLCFQNVFVILVLFQQQKNTLQNSWVCMNVFVCVLYLKHIEYWKCPAIFNKIVPCFMHPAFIEHHSSANNFFCSSLFCHSTSFLTLRSPFHLFVLVFDFSAHFMPVYKNAVLSTAFISGAIASMFLQPSSHFRSSWSYWDRVVEYIPYIQITFCLLTSTKRKVKHAKL